MGFRLGGPSALHVDFAVGALLGDDNGRQQAKELAGIGDLDVEFGDEVRGALVVVALRKLVDLALRQVLEFWMDLLRHFRSDALPCGGWH